MLRLCLSLFLAWSNDMSERRVNELPYYSTLRSTRSTLVFEVPVPLLWLSLLFMGPELCIMIMLVHIYALHSFTYMHIDPWPEDVIYAYIMYKYIYMYIYIYIWCMGKGWGVIYALPPDQLVVCFLEYFCIDDDVVDVGAIVAVVLLVLRFPARI